MTLDKYVSRGFSGSLGSGEGKWVQSSTSSSHSQSAAQSSINHQGGTSFVMGGGGLRGRPSGSKERSQNDSGYADDRYSFDAHDVRHSGTGRHSKGFKDKDQSASLNEWMSTKRGHKVVIGIAMYGIMLFILIFLLISLFGGGSKEGFYTAPAGLSRGARPMWER
jgi:hypothetical protein